MDRLCNSRRKIILICFLLVAVTLGTYWPVFRNEFIKLDDPQYILDNPHVLSGLNAANVKWAFQAGYASNWHPLTWMSHTLDVQLFLLNPRWHHAESLFLHLCNTLLLFAFLLRTTGFMWRSAIVAALFALHPLHVESVAWAAERKDVLSGFFFMLTLLAYAAYAKSKQSSVISDQSSGKRSPKRSVTFYTLALLCFACGLMSKPMLVTTPFLLLLLDFWPLGRISLLTTDNTDYTDKTKRQKSGKNQENIPFVSTVFSRGQSVSVLRLMLEKLPFLALAIASSAITFFAQAKGHSVSMGLPLSSRASNTVASYLKYLGKTVWPTNLAVFYPHPDLRYPLSNQWPDWQIGLVGLLIIGICIFAIMRLKRQPWFAVGWFWYLGTLVPVIGIVQVGGQAIADRYTYLPLIGVFICLVWGASELICCTTSGIRASSRCLLHLPGFALSGIALIACIVVTNQQVRYWRSSTALFEHALAVTANNTVAHYMLGTELLEKGKFDLAQKHLEQTIEADPGFADAYYSLGYLAALQNRPEDAVKQYEAALRVRPWHALSHNGLGAIFWKQGKLDQAEAEYREALRLAPEFSNAHFNLGIVLSSKRQLPEAEAQFSETIREEPRNSAALSRLAEVLVKQGKWAEAEARARELVHLSPTNAEAHLHLGEVLDRSGKLAEARQQYSSALQYNPNSAEAHYLSGRLLFRLTNSAQATTELQEALRLEPSYVQAHLELGRQLTAEGKTPDGLSEFKEAVRLDPTNSEACVTLAIALMGTGLTNEASPWFTKAAEFNPQLVEHNLTNGKELAAKGQIEAALACFNVALQLAPENAEAHQNLGLLFGAQGKLSDAVSEFQAAIKAHPTAEAYHDLGLAYLMQGQPGEAKHNFEEAVALNPGWAAGLNDLAWLLATNPDASVRNGTEAAKLAEHACAINGKEPRYWGTLDAAYAELGRFPEAILTAEKVKAMASAQGETNLAQAAGQRLVLYRNQMPFRQ